MDKFFDNETVMSLCIVIGIALVSFGAVKLARAVIKAEKEIRKRK